MLTSEPLPPSPPVVLPLSPLVGWVSVFVLVMAILIATLLEWGRPWGAIAYVFGAVLSALGGMAGVSFDGERP